MEEKRKRGGDVEEDAEKGEKWKSVFSAETVKGKQVEVQQACWTSTCSTPSPAFSTSCKSGAVIGLGTARCPTAAYPMSPVKRGYT